MPAGEGSCWIVENEILNNFERKKFFWGCNEGGS
jgi:hypothetical protein